MSYTFWRCVDCGDRVKEIFPELSQGREQHGEFCWTCSLWNPEVVVQCA